METTHGHPLALTLLVDLLEQDSDEFALPEALGNAPEVVQQLLERFVAGVPTSRQRQALRACAYARTTTEGMLRAALSIEDARDLFDWLRGLSFVEEEPRGIRPHDLARDVLVADARWRDPDEAAHLHRRVHDYVVAHLREPSTDPQQAVADLIHLHRSNPFAARIWDWRALGGVYADSLRPSDRDVLVTLTARHEGAASAWLVAHWLDRQPEAFLVFRGGTTDVVGFAAMLALHDAAAQDISADPGAVAIWTWAQRNAPARPGEQVVASRFFIDAERHQCLPSASLNALTIASTQHWLARRSPAWEFITWTDPQSATPLMDYIGFQRIPAADFEVDGRPHAVYAHDWRRRSPEQWLEFMATRELGLGEKPAAAPSDPAPSRLSRAEFARAVRQALRDLQRRNALAGNALMAARVIVDRVDDGSRVEALDAAIRAAVGALQQHPRDVKLHRALERTYLRPAGTQERAAEVLDLPMSTYRRHLSRGVDQVVDWLWERELYGWQDR